jgi:hypothetical protein
MRLVVIFSIVQPFKQEILKRSTTRRNYVSNKANKKAIFVLNLNAFLSNLGWLQQVRPAIVSGL